MYKKVYKLVIWAITTILLVDASFALMNMPSTIAVIAGVLLLVLSAVVPICNTIVGIVILIVISLSYASGDLEWEKSKPSRLLSFLNKEIS